MKLTWKSEHEGTIVAEKPDAYMKQYFRNKLKEAYDTELAAFLEEVSVTLRKLPPGRKTKVESRPIVVHLEREKDKTE